MIITYLLLKNFANIYTATRLKEIEIDLSKSLNNIVLIIGKNGSGKTSILAELHPFAYPGNSDVRNNTSLILEGHDGYKEIHITHEGHDYIIRHNYKNNKGKIILKSYFERDGVELNTNGNVTSFVPLVKGYLSLEPEFLKLTRLGPNVTNLIDMKSTERKNFAPVLLSGMGEYNSYFKKISKDNNLLHAMIGNVSEKLLRLHMESKEELLSCIKMEESNIKHWEDKLNKDTISLGESKGFINALIPQGLDTFKGEVDNLKNEAAEIKTKLDNYKIASDKIVRLGSFESELENLFRDKDKATENYLQDKIQLANLQEKQNEIQNKISEAQLKLAEMSSEDNRDSLLSEYEKLKAYIDEYKELERFVPPCTKDAFFNLLGLLKTIDDLASTIYTFDRDSIIKAVDLISSGSNVDRYIESELSKLDSKYHLSKAIKNTDEQIRVIFRDPNCPIHECPYIQYYNEMAKSSNTDNSISEETMSIKRDKLTEIKAIASNIDNILMILKSNEFILKNIEMMEYLTANYIFRALKMGESLYDESEMTNLASTIERYEWYVKKKNQLSEIELELSKLNASGNITSLKKELIELNLEAGKIDSELNKAHMNVEVSANKIVSIEYMIEALKNDEDLKRGKQDLEDRLSAITNEINTRMEIMRTLWDHEENIIKINLCIEEDNTQLSKCRDSLNELKRTLKEYETLTKEKELLVNKYDDINIIKESLSSSKGIPLLYMQLYLRNAKSYVNELLSFAYPEGEFMIEDFIISPTEFSIPYTKNGITVSDISFASQGERSLVSVALSFALMAQSVKEYNILLLDEMDSPLDYKKKSIFLDILLRHMNLINADQIFLITHSETFEGYPTDVILTSDTNYNLEGKNIIYHY